MTDKTDAIQTVFQHIHDSGTKGDIARELYGILTDFSNEIISKEDKDALVNQIIDTYRASELADDEESLRWAVEIASVVTSVV